MTLDEEFGAGASAITRCLSDRRRVKAVVQINHFCQDDVPDANCGADRAFGLFNMNNMFEDYAITNGMVPGKDFETIGVIHSGGAPLALKNNDAGRNPYEAEVQKLLGMGVKFYLCQNAVRDMQKNGALTGDVAAQLIPGVRFVTAGVTAIVDFQELGCKYIQP